MREKNKMTQQIPEKRPRIMTIEELAKYLRLHKSTVYRMVRQGEMPSSKIGNQWRFRKDVIDAWLSKKEHIEKE
jgi:excisionase family DNA binding protein